MLPFPHGVAGYQIQASEGWLNSNPQAGHFTVSPSILLPPVVAQPASSIVTTTIPTSALMLFIFCLLFWGVRNASLCEHPDYWTSIPVLTELVFNFGKANSGVANRSLTSCLNSRTSFRPFLLQLNIFISGPIITGNNVIRFHELFAFHFIDLAP